MIPVIDHAMANGCVYAIDLGMGISFVTDVKVEILDASFGRKMARLG